uniref:(northern house mosquito) hypothetical protein n=1 Tax=Culex pipiens TaxID=7175 RepID=A0A8D8NK62_CULPI
MSSSLDVVGCGDSGSGVGSDESRLKLNWARCTGTCWNMFCSRTRPPPRFFFRYSTSLAPSDDSKMLSCSKLSMSDRRIGLLGLKSSIVLRTFRALFHTSLSAELDREPRRKRFIYTLGAR